MPPAANLVRTDQQVKKDIVDHLVWDARVDASNVSVEVNNGKVALTGNVTSIRARRAAEEDARGIRGVCQVDNQLTVIHADRTVQPDDEICANADSSLHWSSDINPQNVTVEVFSGVVTLKGTVESYWQRTLAEELVDNVDGASEVNNELAVVPTESLGDQAIAACIEQALARTAYLNAGAVTVKVDNGTVTLSGAVSTWAAYRSACEAAVYTGGVKDIVNNLCVMPQA